MIDCIWLSCAAKHFGICQQATPIIKVAEFCSAAQRIFLDLPTKAVQMDPNTGACAKSRKWLVSTSHP
jgi:hypothetical protein